MLAMRIQFYGTSTDALQTVESCVNVKGIVNVKTQSLNSAGLLSQSSSTYSKSLLRDLART